MCCIREDGTTRTLGTFATPEEAALRYARHVGADRAATEAAAARIAAPQPLTADEARAAAAAEGLVLVPSSAGTGTGFKGVFKHRRKYVAHIRESAVATRSLGTFATPEEAALRYARHVGAERAAAEAAEARLAAPPPLMADEVRAAAEAEGLVLVPSTAGTGTGFKGTRKQNCKYVAQIREDGAMRHLGTFATPEEAALCYARHVGAGRAAAEAAAAQHQKVADRTSRLRQEAAAATLAPKPRVAAVAGAAAMRAALGAEAQAGHLFPVGSWLEGRPRALGNRHPQFERVRVRESDDRNALRIERGRELHTIDLDDWDWQPAPALPPAPLAFGVGQMPPDDATAHPSLLSAGASPGVDWTVLAAWFAAGAASTVADPPAPAAVARAALPAVSFDPAQPPPVAKWLDAVLGALVDGWPHPERRALDEKLLACDVRTAARRGMEGSENFLRWGGRLPPVGVTVHDARQQARVRRGVATVAAAVREQAGLVPWRGGELQRRLRGAEWPEGVEPPDELPPLALQLYVGSSGTWGHPFAYSIDRDWAIRGAQCTYDVGTFHVVPLVWQSPAGLDQDKVFAIVYTRARWTADTAARRAAAALAARDSATPLRSTLVSRLQADCGDRPRDQLDLGWAIDRYVHQEGACHYTGVTLAVSGPIFTTPFVLSFERLDEDLEYTRDNTVLVAAEFNTGCGVQMSEHLADLLYGPKR